MKKVWFLMFLLLLPVSFASWNSLRTCNVGQNCELTIFTVNTSNVTQLLNVSSCYITVWDKSNYGTYLFVNQTMDKMNISQGLHNYTINFSSIGHYPAWIYCNGTNVDDSIDLSFEVINQTTILNNTGLFISVASSSWATAVILALLITIAILSYYSIKLVNLNKYIRLLLFFMSFFLLIITVNLASSITQVQSSTSTDVISLLGITHSVLIWTFVFVFGVLFLLFMFGIIDNLRKRKGDITP